MIYYLAETITYSLYLTTVSVNPPMSPSTYNAYVIAASIVNSIGNCTYYIAHWQFAWKYYIVSKIMKNLNSNEAPYNKKLYHGIDILMCTVIVINEVLSDYERG